ncbi:MAG: ParB/RepB/Spo0J family partition protein [Thermoanaerobaculia bacterium]|nr:ParB/RepB/Spo0J family partition protein [Thermoanaerobaculia bacterium]
MRHEPHFVDQLFRGEEISIGRRIALNLIEANPDQPRSILGDLQDLKASIEAKGVLEPILVRPREGGRFTIISGERRFRAAMEAGLSDIPCIVLDVSDAEVVEIALIENLQRKDLSPLEEADGYSTLQDKHGYTHEQIARAVGKSRVTITETLSLVRLPWRVKDECRRADIRSKSFLLEVGRLPDEPAMLDAIAAFESGDGVGRDALRSARREGEPSEGPRFRSLRKAYELNFQPADAPYAVSLVFRGSATDRSEILRTLRDLIRRIDSGEVNLEEHGRFLKAGTTRSEKEAGETEAQD